MGLDTVELVMAMEEEFGLSIPESAAEKMYTVGDTYEWLKARLGAMPPIECLSQKIFYKLRRALIENYGLSRQQIDPDTKLTDLLPHEEIESGWPFLQLFIDLKTPDFEVANKFLGFRLRKETLTMRELVHSLILINQEAIPLEKDSAEGIWLRLVEVIASQLNVRRDQIRPEASYTRDLGVD